MLATFKHLLLQVGLPMKQKTLLTFVPGLQLFTFNSLKENTAQKATTHHVFSHA